MGPVLINDMQILPQPPPPSKVAGLGFWSKKMCNVLKPMKNNFPFFAIFNLRDVINFVHKILRKLDP